MQAFGRLMQFEFDDSIGKNNCSISQDFPDTHDCSHAYSARRTQSLFLHGHKSTMKYAFEIGQPALN